MLTWISVILSSHTVSPKIPATVEILLISSGAEASVLLQVSQRHGSRMLRRAICLEVIVDRDLVTQLRTGAMLCKGEIHSFPGRVCCLVGVH